jgi:hypothetical protein
MEPAWCSTSVQSCWYWLVLPSVVTSRCGYNADSSLALQLLVLELPVAEVVFSRLVRHEPSSRLDRSSEQERESASLPVSPVRTCTSAYASTSASPFCYQTTPGTLRQRQPFPPAPLAFTAPPNPFSQLGVEDDLANISLFEEDAMAMDWNLH